MTQTGFPVTFGLLMLVTLGLLVTSGFLVTHNPQKVLHPETIAVHPAMVLVHTTGNLHHEVDLHPPAVNLHHPAMNFPHPAMNLHHPAVVWSHTTEILVHLPRFPPPRLTTAWCRLQLPPLLVALRPQAVQWSLVALVAPAACGCIVVCVSYSPGSYDRDLDSRNPDKHS